MREQCVPGLYSGGRGLGTRLLLVLCSGLTVRVRSSTWGSTFFLLFFLSIPASLLMGSLPLQTIVNMWQHFHLFFKACTKGYVVYSCLAGPDKEAVIHSATCTTKL